MAGFGFSIGDILAAADFVKSIQQAVREGTGSLAEYEGLLKALDSTETSLRLLTSLKVDEEHKPALNKIFLAYERSFAEFGKVTSKYDTSLGKAQRPSRWWQELPKKVKWQKYSKAGIARLQYELQMHSDAMQTLMLRIIVQQHHDSDTSFTTFSTDVLSKLVSQVQLLFSMFGILICVWSCMQDVALAIKRLGSMLSHYQRLITDQVPKAIATATARLQDANGLFHSLDLNIVRSWRCLRIIINDIFKGQPGWRRVKQGRYLLCDAFTTQRLDSTHSFAYYFRHGREINMNAIFGLDEISDSICPRCSAARPMSNDAHFTCKCGFYCGRVSKSKSLLSLSLDNKNRSFSETHRVPYTGGYYGRKHTSRLFVAKLAINNRVRLSRPRRQRHKMAGPKRKLEDKPSDFIRISVLQDDISEQDNTVSLAQLLSEESPRKLSQAERIRIAIVVASAHLRLYSSEWSTVLWHAGNVVFLRATQEDPALQLDRMFIRRLASPTSDHTLPTSDTRYNGLYDLGILLLEIGFGQILTREDLQHSPPLRHQITNHYLDALEGHTSIEYHRAVAWCLNRTSTTSGAQRVQWQQEFEREVLQPLRDNVGLITEPAVDDID